tara:strand:+ start:1786 stop:2640 length:855 start_codon:yes stop_codon:yes gene_type:complete
MQNWEKFEKESTLYLNNSFLDINAKFSSLGGKNSEASDILVHNENGVHKFNIEVKLSPSQSGQFVVFQENNKYQLTKQSKLTNPCTQDILDYLNIEGNKYLNFKSATLDVNCDNYLLINWVKNHYINKKSFFIITSENLSSFKAIIPIVELENYFTVTACMRKKRSGTSHLSTKRYNTFIKQGNLKVINHIEDINEKFVGLTKKGKRVILEIENKNKILNKPSRYFDENLFLSPIENKLGYYYIKQQSNTNNINIIFSLIYTGEKNNIGIDSLRSAIIEGNYFR